MRSTDNPQPRPALAPVLQWSIRAGGGVSRSRSSDESTSFSQTRRASCTSTGERRNKMDLSLGVAVGSSIQIALFATPMAVLFGWFLDKPFSLDFHMFQIVVLLVSILILNSILVDNRSNWLQGSMLITSYLTICTIYWVELPGGGFGGEGINELSHDPISSKMESAKRGIASEVLQ